MDLRKILKELDPQRSKDLNLLVGFETADDAGVYKITEDIALVQTVDFVTPACDDPYMFGQIAAANSLSDIYAMGGRAVTALNICCFPQEGVDPQVYAEILRGGADKVAEAGAVLAGGHTVKDNELKYGLSVTGIVHPDRILRNSTSKPGDKIVLTKKIGTGMIISGIKNDLISMDAAEDAYQSMVSLNKTAAEVMIEVGAHACTDISGFGLAGHLCEVAMGSGVKIILNLRSVPVFPVSIELFGRGLRTAMAMPNKQSTAEWLVSEIALSKEQEGTIFDPQTSGPLAISVPAEKADLLIDLLHKKGVAAATIIGEVEASSAPGLLIRDSL